MLTACLTMTALLAASPQAPAVGPAILLTSDPRGGFGFLTKVDATYQARLRQAGAGYQLRGEFRDGTANGALTPRREDAKNGFIGGLTPKVLFSAPWRLCVKPSLNSPL